MAEQAVTAVLFTPQVWWMTSRRCLPSRPRRWESGGRGRRGCVVGGCGRAGGDGRLVYPTGLVDDQQKVRTITAPALGEWG